MSNTVIITQKEFIHTNADKHLSLTRGMNTSNPRLFHICCSFSSSFVYPSSGCQPSDHKSIDRNDTSFSLLGFRHIVYLLIIAVYNNLNTNSGYILSDYTGLF